ncbi:ThiJ/PfpI [Labilithrix luteola]|uniref:ThiJ/PfpI n=1 Tax=Labilithrix luteola TaxID=1391654 RepID=A0A0K1QFP8_9BACT|nr:DJ-1/PfpI family protein [Labilithrix luteola]AKV04482.1 ThiJ/PfpI [Labilithrix luteola]
MNDVKRVVLVAFDRFTDIDLFLAWDLFARIGPPCSVQIAAKTPRITSSTGLTIDCHAGLAAASEADAVYFCSGPGSRVLVDDAEACDILRLDPSRQVLAAVDSGAIVLGKLGHLRGLRATTYPSPDLHDRLHAYGATLVRSSLVVEGNVATAAQCLAGVELVRWVTARLFDDTVAHSVVASVAAL